MTDLSVVVPTYREAENLPELVARVHQATEAAGISAEIIVVDDNSPDATRSVCAELAERFPLRLLVREHERGLSSAVIAGMRLAKGDVLLCMDADLSHPPEMVPTLYRAVADPGDEAEPAGDFAVGSRYVPGGGTDAGWGLGRWLNSMAATWLARPLTSVRDPMAGFFALRAETFRSAAATLDPVGWKIGLELIVKSGARRVIECPIHFRDRTRGESKLSLREQFNYLRHLRRLYGHRYPNLTWFALFAAVGLSGMAVDLAAYAALLKVLPLPAAAALAIWTAMTWNFLLNRHVTFGNVTPRRPWQWQYLAYCASCLFGAVLNWSTRFGLSVLTETFADHPLWSAAAGVLAGTASNFLLCRFMVFGPQSPEKPAPAPSRHPAPDANVSTSNVTREMALAEQKTAPEHGPGRC
jgi:dolichol-phosphate mannosyltransferase